MPVAKICRRAGISQAKYIIWKKKYDGLLPTGMKRLQQIEDENGRLRKLVADLSLDREMLQDVIRRKLVRRCTRTRGARRSPWSQARAGGRASGRLGCVDPAGSPGLKMDTSSYHYRSRRPDQAGIEARIKAICETRVRYSYRRVHVLLQREAWRINVKKTHRIYNALGLQLRNKTPKRMVKAKLREDRC